MPSITGDAVLARSLADRAGEEHRHCETHQCHGATEDIHDEGIGRAGITSIDGLANARVAERREEVRDHSESDERSPDPGRTDTLNSRRKVLDARGLS